MVWKLFNKFFVRLDHRPRTWSDRLSLFVAYLVDNNKQASMVKSYISGIKAVLKMNKIKVNEDQYLLSAMIKACKLKGNKKVCHRQPIQHGMLAKLLDKINLFYLGIGQPYLAKLYRALFSTAYYGLFRVTKLTTGAHPVLACDVQIGMNKKKIRFILRSSKTHTTNMPPQIVNISATKVKNNSHMSGTESVGSRLPCPYMLLRQYFRACGGY